MDDISFWWYIIAAVIYFLTRAKKKKQPNQPGRPGTENQPKNPPKSFEELLREITGEETVAPVEQEPMVITETRPTPQELEAKRREDQRLEGEQRAFADEESRKIYEESIKQAEGADLKFERDIHFRKPVLSKEEEEAYTFADEIRDGLSSAEARKAIIYSEILNRKY